MKPISRLRTARPLRSLATALLVVLSGCARTDLVAGDRAFEHGRYQAAETAYQRAARADRGALLFREALLAATPGSPTYDPRKARALLERLRREHGGGVYGTAAARGLEWLEQRDALQARVAQTEARLAECRDATERDALQHRQEVQALRDALSTAEAEQQRLQAEVKSQHGERPAAQVQALQDEIARLRHEIDQIKRIDLHR